MDSNASSVDMPPSALKSVDDCEKSDNPALSPQMEKYMMFSAICQGFCVLLNLHSIFMLSNMAPVALGVENFSGKIVFILEFFACTINTLLFWMNAVKPWFTVGACIVQGAANIAQIVVIATLSGTTGMYAYLGVTAALGVIFGCNSMTSFAMMAFGPVNHLGAFSFGFALGGVVPFFFSSILQNTAFTGNTVEDVRGMMYCIMGFVAAMSIISGVNLAFYLSREQISKHYNRIKVEGISTVKCTFRAALKGLKYTWKIVLVDLISYVNLLSFYPGVVPGAMPMDIGRKIMLIGIFQISETVGRFMAVFIDRRWLLCNSLDRVIVLAVCNVGTSVFLVCSTLFYSNVFMGHIVVVTIGVITLGLVGGYCNSFADKSIEENVPKTLEQNVVVSTTTVFKIVASVFCAVGSLISTFLVKAFPDGGAGH
ncbi:CLN3 protein domain-containing protein [Babesia caballi]|uniref:CLN3 protein domain-containing protein n=1 Tax=Babesia caballi TaxID=5871 RepID=A0AAV4LZ18_BABCB|nr:CLN3 protein domain-containing protein [Babesia caballi]